MTLEDLSRKYFGGEDYKSYLSVLSPASVPVKRFIADAERMGLIIE